MRSGWRILRKCMGGSLAEQTREDPIAELWRTINRREPDDFVFAMQTRQTNA
jgi:hypothetical protein